MTIFKPATPEQIAEKVPPAVQAWFQLRPDSSATCGATLLKNTARSTVCRIEGVGPGGSHIVAKRCSRTDGELEAFVYREVLDRLSLASLHCYGFVDEGDGEYGWLFLEDGGAAQVAGKGQGFPLDFSPWLAQLHASASSLPIRNRLPDRGPAWYLEILRTSRLELCQRAYEGNWDDSSRSAIEEILTCFEILGKNWRLIEERCEVLPRTMVHCDLQAKNILVRHTGNGNAFLPLDWEYAGWGPPAADLAGIDAQGYCSAAQRTWPQLKLQQVQEQINCGKLFHIISAVGWEALRLAAGSEEKALRRLQIYAPRLRAAIQRLGLGV